VATKAAEEAWRLIYVMLFTGEAHARMRDACATAGISPGIMKLLFHLQPGAGVAMRDVSEHFDVDASWVTSVVDELESKGLARRLPHPSDRRVKMVALTDKGAAIKQQAFEHVVTPPASLDALSATEQRQLRDLMRKVATADTRLRGGHDLHAVTS
jgi:DNA-binding MarR family transcriptional regulator